MVLNFEFSNLLSSDIYSSFLGQLHAKKSALLGVSKYKNRQLHKWLNQRLNARNGSRERFALLKKLCDIIPYLVY